jgi:hypothetical protein
VITPGLVITAHCGVITQTDYRDQAKSLITEDLAHAGSRRVRGGMLGAQGADRFDGSGRDGVQDRVEAELGRCVYVCGDVVDEDQFGWPGAQ